MMKENVPTSEDMDLLNSKLGLYALLRNKKVNVDKALESTRHTVKLKKAQEELIKLHNWVINTNQKVVVLFEGRDAAGKGGAIRRITEYINPRHFKIIALNKPNSDEKEQWFFQRYINHLPKPGEIVFFDRSWYNRAGVDPVNNFCTQEEYEIFMSQVNDFEKMLLQSGTFLIKFYFSISKEEQKKRFDEIKKSPLKRWKMTDVDRKAQELWDDYTKYKERMFNETNTEIAPWIVIEGNNKPIARIKAIQHLLEMIPYEHE
ncbi:polyphosphate kinase 2 [Kriegella sp. EG-1]|nr:polyphosphate kinase 2 [Flavobacteriaceae bacterium EG-1]